MNNLNLGGIVIDPLLIILILIILILILKLTILPGIFNIPLMNGGCNTCKIGGNPESSKSSELPGHIPRLPQINALDRELDGLIQGGGAPIVDVLNQPKSQKPRVKYIASNELIKLKTIEGEELTLQNNKLKVSKDVLGNELFKLRFYQNTKEKRNKSDNRDKESKESGQNGGGITYVKYGLPLEINFTNPTSGQSFNIRAEDELNTNKGDKKFILINKKDPLDEGLLSFDSEVLIKTVKGYLVTDGDNIKTNGNVSNATTWTIQHQKGCGPLWRFSSNKKNKKSK